MSEENNHQALDAAAGRFGPADARKARISRDFQQAKRRAVVEDLLSYIRREPVELLPFEEVRQRLRLSSKFYRGLQNIPLDKIIGSTGRYDDFTRTFMPRKYSSQQRWERVDSMIQQGGWPPVELYQVSDIYFVHDGHHRVSVARQQDAETIEAHVWEYPSRVPLWNDDELKDVQIREEYLRFLDRTQLDKLRPDQEIIFTERGRYWLLEEEIAIHRYYMGLERGQEPSFQEAMLDWYDRVYLPMARTVLQENILEYFPGRTEADLVIWIINHQYWLEQKYGGEEDVTFEEAVQDFTKRTRRNPWRRLRAWVAHHLLGAPIYGADLAKTKKEE